MRPPSPEQQRRLVDAWNNARSTGAPVRYWTGTRSGPGVVSRTSSAAFLLGGHTAAVFLDGVSGCVALSHVDPTPVVLPEAE